MAEIQVMVPSSNKSYFSCLLPVFNHLYQNQVKLPITETVGKQIVTLPMHPNLSDDDVDKIIYLTNRFSN